MPSLISLSFTLLLSGSVDASWLYRRDECRFIQIEPAQGCDTLAQRCNVTTAQLEEYNPRDSFCTTVRIGERICCTPGELPPIESNPDGTCKHITVEDGDNCDVVAAECDISVPELLTFNDGGTDFCSKLQPGKQLCCTPGDLADDSAEANEDGSCADYTIGADDTCASIAREHNLKGWEAVEEFNEGTWGWRGCDAMLVGTVICVGEGEAPMPAQDPDAECGPRVQGTERPDNETAIGDLNPCEDGRCCSFYGFCGTSEEHCEWDSSDGI